MTIKIGEFKRVVRKTTIPRNTKLALRVSAKDSGRVNIAKAAVLLKSDTGRLLQALSGYVLGAQTWTPAMRDEAFTIMGDIGGDLTALAAVLKVKLPSSTKKIKLKGTRGAAILVFDGLTTDILSVVHQGVFATPKLTTVTKLVVMPNKGGEKVEKQVQALDSEAEIKAELGRREILAPLVAEAIDLFWRLSFDMLDQAPAEAFAAKFERLKIEYPNVQFAEAPATA